MVLYLEFGLSSPEIFFLTPPQLVDYPIIQAAVEFLPIETLMSSVRNPHNLTTLGTLQNSVGSG